MLAVTLLLVFASLCSLVMANETNEFTIHAIKFAKHHAVSARSGALKKASVAMRQNDHIKLVFCLTEATDVGVSGLSFSNDGGEDKVAVYLDWNSIGTVSSPKRMSNGAGWNIFTNSGPIGLSRTLQPGRHSLVLNVTDADEFGIEIDSVNISVTDMNLNEDAFSCNVFCFNDISYDNIEGRDYIASARLENLSYKSECAEVDNIKIPFYHDHVTKFSVTASHPKYKAFVNSRQPDFSNCKMVNRLLWQFENLTYPFETKQFKRGRAVITQDKNDDHDILVTFFLLYGPRKGSVESDIGSNLFLLLRNVNEPVTIGFSYYGRRLEWSVADYVEFSPEKQNHTWNIPDYSWNASPENVVRLLLPLNNSKGIEIELLSMNMRETKHDSAFKIFDNKEKIIEGVTVDFFWKSGEKMKVKVKDSGDVYANSDYVRIYTHVPWGEAAFSQVFVLYRDGNIRILPLSPPGLDWIPFGSSVIIGESNPNDERPYALIEDIEIDIQRSEIKIRYANGNSATLELHSEFAKTSIIVKDIKFQNKVQLPFMIYRSMWVSDGNSDVDHVTVNHNVPKRILGEWDYLFGTSIAFFRQCLSRHNTLGPDIQVELLEEDWG